MRITVVAATGGVGRLVAERAVEAGHEVTAVARRPEHLPAGVRGVAVDLATPDMEALAKAVAGADAVLSGLGPRNRGEDGIASRGTRAIVDAMTAAGTRRLVVAGVSGIAMTPGPGEGAGGGAPPGRRGSRAETGAGAQWRGGRDPGAGWFTRAVLGPLARARLARHYADIADMVGLLRGSGLEWTVAGFPLLTDRAARGVYRTAYDQSVRGGWRIGRADAAGFMLRAAAMPDTVRRCVAVAY